MQNTKTALHRPYCRILMISVFVTLILTGCGKQEPASIDLRVDFLTNLGNEPFFSWKTDKDATGKSQTAFQILVASDPSEIEKGSADIWDSGKSSGALAFQVSYGGPKLESGKKYYTVVRSWDQLGEAGGWSPVQSFVVPLTYPADWKAQWITYAYVEGAPLPLFRKSFQLKDTENIKYARFYIAAPGFYEASVNGQKIGENVLDPGQTNYEDYTYYTAYDINPEDLKEENALGVMLGNGWYNQNVVWKGQAEYSQMVYGQPVFIAQLVVHRKDGEIEIIGSDDSWRWSNGPITYSNIYGGEHYDARLEEDDWNTPDFNDGEWNIPESPDVHPTRLFEQFAEPIKVMGEIEAKEIIAHVDGSYIFDFGQNMAGWMELSIEGERGQEISIQCTEVLDEEGNLDPRTTGVRATTVIQTQKYICSGEGVEIWRPRFTYFGFRFAQVKGLKKTPEKCLLTGQVLYSSVKDVGAFSCSEENINRLHELSRWTIIGNIHSIPTDCPHREKCGWTGDAHAMIQPMIYNFDAQRFFEKYMFDMRSSAREEKEELYFGKSFNDRSMVMKPAGVPTMIVPGKRTSGCATPDWGTAMVQIPWYLYLYYGDRVLLEDFYSDMRVWVEYVEGMKEDGIIPHGLGDWCPPGGNKNIDCPVPFSSSAFHILDVTIMEKVAGLLGKGKDEFYYAGLLQQLKADFNRHFFDSETRSYGSSQTANIMALDMQIVPKGRERAVCMEVLKNIREEHDGFLNTGIFGLARVFKVLSENGYENEVYRLLTRTEDNSFANMWDSFDVTTLWETLPTNVESGSTYSGSMSHPMQAGFDSWFFSGIAGIIPLEDGPGFRHIEFRPYLTDQMEWASASYEAKSGTIISNWKRDEGGLSWKIRIPANSVGDIHVPTYGSEGEILVNGELVNVLTETGGFGFIGKYGPGEYLVEISSGV